MPRPKLKIKGATFARGATYTRVITVYNACLLQMPHSLWYGMLQPQYGKVA